MLQKLLVVTHNPTFTQPLAASAAILACGKEYLIDRVITLPPYTYTFTLSQQNFHLSSNRAIYLAGMHCRRRCASGSPYDPDVDDVSTERFRLVLDGDGEHKLCMVFVLRIAWICLGSNGPLVS